MFKFVYENVDNFKIIEYSEFVNNRNKQNQNQMNKEKHMKTLPDDFILVERQPHINVKARHKKAERDPLPGTNFLKNKDGFSRNPQATFIINTRST